MSFQGSFKNGVVSAILSRKTIDFTGFFGTLQDTAVADEKYSNHKISLSQNALKCRVLFFRGDCEKCNEITKSEGKTKQVDAVKRSMNLGVFTTANNLMHSNKHIVSFLFLLQK